MDHGTRRRAGDATLFFSQFEDWTYESSFGEGQGAHAGVWECPDLIELPVKGTELKKWVLICNINPVVRLAAPLPNIS